MIKNIFEILPLIVASISLLVAYCTYLRQKTFENENHLFKYKLDKYHEILNTIHHLFTFLEDKIGDYYVEAVNNPRNKKGFEVIEDELDVQLEKAELEIFANAAFLPEKVFFEIDELVGKLFEAEFFVSPQAQTFDAEMDKLEKIEDMIFDIAEAMREDLGIDPLNVKLHKRTRDLKHKSANVIPQ